MFTKPEIAILKTAIAAYVLVMKDTANTAYQEAQKTNSTEDWGILHSSAANTERALHLQNIDLTMIHAMDRHWLVTLSQAATIQFEIQDDTILDFDAPNSMLALDTVQDELQKRINDLVDLSSAIGKMTAWLSIK